MARPNKCKQCNKEITGEREEAQGQKLEDPGGAWAARAFKFRNLVTLAVGLLQQCADSSDESVGSEFEDGCATERS